MKLLLLFLLVFPFSALLAQKVDSSLYIKKYVTIEEALKEPIKVYQLDLSGKEFLLKPNEWLLFTNLEYLNLNNNHLKEIPKEIGTLPKLKVLELSGNDFNLLPESFKQLNTLEEIYLNEEPNIALEENLELLSTLPNLRILHLELNKLRSLPDNIYKLENLEELYLNGNELVSLPSELGMFKKLMLLNIQDNKIEQPISEKEQRHFGFKIFF